MTADLAFAAWCRARYLTPDKYGKTRAERNAAAVADGEAVDPTPEWEIPEYAEYLWNWFVEIDDGINRITDGSVNRITWQDFAAWRSVTENQIYAHEFAILNAVDLSYCEALEGELQYARATAEDEARREAETQARASQTTRGRK